MVVPQRTSARVTAAIVVVLLLAGASVAFIAARDDNEATSIASAGPGLEPITRLDADIQLARHVDATDEQTAEVRDFAQLSPGVAAYTYVSSEDSLLELQAILACSSDSTGTPRLPAMPAIFRFRTTNVEDEQGLVSELAALSGVDRVITRSDSVAAGSGSNSGTDVDVVVTPTTLPAEAPTDAPATSTSSPATPPSSPESKEIPFVAPEPDDCSAPSGGQTVPATPVQPPVQPSAPTLPPAGEAPADAASAEAAVQEMWTLAFSASTPDAERYALHEVSQDHPEVFDGGLPQNQQYRDNLSVKVLGVVFESPTRAAVLYQLEFPALHSTQPPDIGYAVLTGDGWKVARETTCALVAKGGRQCPP